MSEEREMTRLVVGEIKSGGTTWEVAFQVNTHNFWATSPGFHDVQGRTWDEVDAEVRKRVGKAKARVSVPYVALVWVSGPEGKTPTLVPGTATGIHNGNGKVLATQGGRARTIDLNSWGSADGYMTPFSDADRIYYLGLLADRASLGARIKRIEDEHKFDGRNLRAKVEKEVEAARVAMAEAEAASDAEEPGHGYWEAGDL